MDLKLHVNLAKKSWALGILEAMHAGTPGRQAALISATGAGRGAFAQSLDHLITLGLIERHPGHGHPLRSEYQLTEDGRVTAERAARTFAVAAEPDERALLRKSWSLPVLGALNQPCRFSQLRRDLTPITDRALSQTLQSLERLHWVERRITPARPPRPLYTAVNKGALIQSVWAEN